jgi:heme/copper-type cytochrome/quinol oxidase subunit 3
MSEFAQHGTPYSVLEEEPPELAANNLRTGAHLWASATAFFFIGFLFAYFYLRSLNNGGMWRPKHVDPSLTLGTLAMLAVVGTAALLALGYRDHVRDELGAWRRKGGLAIALLVAAIALQIALWATNGFGPTQGAYASVYVGWTGMTFTFLIGLLYWLETTLATSLRYRKVTPAQFEPGEAAGDPHRASADIRDPLSVVRAQLGAVSFYAQFMALIAVITWIVLYLA